MQIKTFFSAWETFTCPNACAIQINIGINELLKKTVLENMGYWQKESEIDKKVGCFKVPLGLLGLITVLY